MKFHGDARPIPDAVRASMHGNSWKPGCPVQLDALALLQLTHIGFDGAVHAGALIVAADVADSVLRVFATLFDARFPIERMVLVDAYGGDDDRSMAANNSSGFNGRYVAGTTKWSLHAHGLAVDVNPVQNPWVQGALVSPPAGVAYLDRRPGPGVIVDGDVVVRAFESIGWSWGGRWADPDLHHFQRGEGTVVTPNQST